MKNITLKILLALALCSGAKSVDAQIDTTRIHRLDEVVVTGARYESDVRHLPLTVSVIERNQIENNPSSSVLPVLTEQVPGMFITSRGIMGYGVSGGAAGGMNLRGLGGGSARLMVLVDGHPQYMGLMGHPIADAYQSMMTERVEVLRGPASVIYGSNAMGGVVNIVTRQMREDGIQTQAELAGGSYGTMQAEVSNRIKKGKFTSITSASYNHTDGHRENMNFDQYSGYVKLGYELSESWKLGADVNLMQFKGSQPGTTSQPLEDADQRITRGMTSFALENRYEKTSGTLSFFYNWGRHKINDGYNAQAGETPLDYRFNSTDQMLGVSWYQSAQLFEGNRTTIGLDWFHFGGQAWNQYLEGKRVDIVDKHQNEIAGYVDFRQMLSSWMTFNAGLRVDNHDQAGTEWIPQAGLAFHLPKDAELKLSASRGFRYPIIREMFMWGIANPNLEAESIWNYELAFSQKLMDNKLMYGVNVFHLRGDNMIAVAPVDGKMMNVNTGKIENTGAELQLVYRFSPILSLHGNYSYLHMENPVIGSPEHKLYAGINALKGAWEFSTGVQYVAGLYKSVNPNEQEDFVLWNMRGSYKVNDHLKLWLSGENLLAQKYEVMSGYPMPKTTLMGGIKLAL
ncbi:MAG: TonB-dependent receptor [Bacteroidaceae bacterium]|nr:TonB-dependent receptor [Bacteroidaceae bacterium]